MGRRFKIGRFYVERRKNGQFKKFVAIGRSLSVDRRKRAVRTVRSGYGHIGDRRRRR